MGMAASQSRLLMLTARLSDLELRAQQIQNAKIRNSMQVQAATANYIAALNNNNSSGAVTTDSNISSSGSVDATQFEATMYALEGVDKLYDMELKNIDTEHQAIQTEIDSVKKVIDKNIERSFKIFQA